VDGSVSQAASEAAEADREGRRRRRRGGRGGRDRDETGSEDTELTETGAAARDASAETVATPRAEGEAETADRTDAPETAGAESEEREGGRRRGRGRDRDRFRRERRPNGEAGDVTDASDVGVVEGESSPAGEPAQGVGAAPETAAAAQGAGGAAVDEQAQASAIGQAPAAAVQPLASAGVSTEPAADVAATAAAPATSPAPRVLAEPYVLPVAQLHQIAQGSGLQWVNSDADKIAAAQAAIAAQPQPAHVPRERKPVVVVDEGPLVLVETRKDLSQLKLPFETAADSHQG
jgi:ribonuclease E